MSNDEPSWWAMTHMTAAKRFGTRMVFVVVGSLTALLVGGFVVVSVIGFANRDDDSPSTTIRPAPAQQATTTTLSTEEKYDDLSRGADVGYLICMEADVATRSELNDAIELMAGQAARDGDSVQYAEGLALGCTERYLEAGGE